jgi:hypothetical protein
LEDYRGMGPVGEVVTECCYLEGESFLMTVALKNRTPVVVPAAALRRAGFTSGQDLEIKASAGVITILPKSLEKDEYTQAQRRSIDRGIAASENDYAEGRSFGPFPTHEGFLASLHAEAAKLRKKKSKRAVMILDYSKHFLRSYFQSPQSRPGSLRQAVCDSCSQLTSPITSCKEIR